MTCFDVEIEQLKKELPKYNYDFDEYKRCSEQLIDNLEFRIQQLKDRIKDIGNEVTEY